MILDSDFVSLITNQVKSSSDNWGTGVILYNRAKDSILMAERTDTHQLATPGGKVELNESPKDGIIRECLEESNVRIVNMCCYGFRTHSDDHNRDWVDYLFYSDVFDDREIRNQKSEMGPFKWYPVNSIISLDLFKPCSVAIDAALSIGLLDGNCDSSNYVPFIDVPSTPSAVSDSVVNAYSYTEPETIFTNNRGFYWD